MLFGNADKKATKETVRVLNKEFDQIIASYELGMDQGDAMLEFFINQWMKRLAKGKEVKTA